MASVFTKIITGEFPSYKVYEDDLIIAILALDQVNLGHTLVIPKQESNHWFDVPEQTFLHLQKKALQIGKAIHSATGSARVLTVAVGFEVPHYHLHLIPAWSASDLDFSKGKRRSEAEMQDIQKKIQNLL